MRFVLIFFFTAFCFSCERSVNDITRVSIQLPILSQSKNYSNFTAQISDPFSILNTNYILADVALISGDINNTKNVFNSLVPSLASAASIPVNCYLLVVSGPEEETDFLKNYCSKKVNPASNLLIDINSPQLNFGPYSGLIDAFNFGGRVEMQLTPGKDRVFTLLGFNALNGCSEIFSALRDKSKLSKAYRIASSDPKSLMPGASTTVSLTLPLEVDQNDFFSDCVIPDPETIYPIYSNINVSKPGFPYDTYRSFSTTQTTNYYCEPVDISLRARDPYTSQIVPGTVAEDTYFKIRISSADVPTYDTAENCIADTSVDDSSAEDLFKFSKNQIHQKRWFKQRRGGTSSISVSVVKADGTTISSTSFRQYFSLSGVFVDTVLPTQVEYDVCYEATVFLRDINGYSVTSTSNFNITNAEIPTSLTSTIFQSNSDCESNSNPNPTINFSIGQNSVSYFVKFFDAGIFSFEYAITPSDGALLDARLILQTVTPDPSTDLDSFAFTRINSKSNLPNNPAVPAGKSDCFPVFVSLIRSDETEFVLNSASTQTLLPIKLRVADVTGPDTDSYSLYSDDFCTAPLYPVGSTASSSGSDLSAPPAGSSFYKFYIKPDNSGQVGARKLELFYSGSLIGFFQFELTDANR